MGYIYKNITGNTAVCLARRNYEEVFTGINFCNIHASDEVKIDLYLERSSIRPLADAYEKDPALENSGGDPATDFLSPLNSSWDGTNLNNLEGEDFEQERMEDGSYNIPTRTTYTYYLLKNTSIPYGQTLILEESDLIHDFSKFKLMLKLDQADSAVDVVVGAKEREQERTDNDRGNDRQY